MKVVAFLTILISITGCKDPESAITLKPVNDKELLDSLKNQYNKRYLDVKDPEKYVSYIGTTTFCYDEQRLKIHKLLFSNTEDERLHETAPMYGTLEKASDSLLKSFSVKERLVFALVYPEFYSQTCGAYIDPNNLVSDQIFSQIPRGFEGYYASNRQLHALIEASDSVSFYLSKCYRERNNLPIELYNYILRLKLYQIIPMLIEHYNRKENYFIVATLITFMVEDNYSPFLQSKLLNDMKGKFYNEGDPAMFLNSVPKTPEKLEQLFFHAQNYYQCKSLE